MACWIRRTALVLYSATHLSPVVAETADTASARAARLQQAGDRHGALAAYLEALELAPKRVDLLSNTALAYLRLGRPNEAIPKLQRARATTPQHPGVVYLLGLSYFQAERFGEARDELATLLSLQPTNQQAAHLYGLCLLKLHDLDQGIGILERVLQAEPGNRQAAYTLGSAYIKSGQIERAERLANELLGSDASPEALLVKGSVRIAQGNHQAGLRTLERAVAQDPKLPALRSQLGVALLHLGHTDRAAREFEAELAANPGDYNANAFLGWLAQQNGQPRRALELLQAAYALDESDPGVPYLLAQAHFAQRDWERAEAMLAEVVERQPGFIPARVMRARVYAKLKRIERFREEQRIIQQLNAEQQERDLRGVDRFYDGTVLSLPGRQRPEPRRPTDPR